MVDHEPVYPPPPLKCHIDGSLSQRKVRCISSYDCHAVRRLPLYLSQSVYAPSEQHHIGGLWGREEEARNGMADAWEEGFGESARNRLVLVGFDQVHTARCTRDYDDFCRHCALGRS